MRSAVLAVSLTLLSAAAGQSSITSISASCQAAALTLVSSPFGACTDLVALVSVLSAQGSVIAPFNTFLQGACSQTCSPAVLSSASSTVMTGCATDLSSGSSVARILSTLVSNYTLVKDVGCLQSTSNTSFCITNVLTSIQTANGSDITVNSVTNLLSGTSLLPTLQALPASAVCTDCLHGLVTKLQVLIPTTSSSTASSIYSGVSSKCGATFVDSKVPAGLAEAGSSSGNSSVTSTPLNGASSLAVGGTAAFAVMLAGGALIF